MQVLVQQVWGGTWDSAFFKNSPAALLLLFHRSRWAGKVSTAHYAASSPEPKACLFLFLLSHFLVGSFNLELSQTIFSWAHRKDGYVQRPLFQKKETSLCLDVTRELTMAKGENLWQMSMSGQVTIKTLGTFFSTIHLKRDTSKKTLVRRGLKGCVSPWETRKGRDSASCRPVNTDAVKYFKQSSSQDPVMMAVPGTVGPGGTEHIVQPIIFSIKNYLFYKKKDCVLANDQG